jgi:hypothetical protein
MPGKAEGRRSLHSEFGQRLMPIGLFPFPSISVMHSSWRTHPAGMSSNPWRRPHAQRRPRTGPRRGRRVRSGRLGHRTRRGLGLSPLQGPSCRFRSESEPRRRVLLCARDPVGRGMVSMKLSPVWVCRSSVWVCAERRSTGGLHGSVVTPRTQDGYTDLVLPHRSPRFSRSFSPQIHMGIGPSTWWAPISTVRSLRCCSP